MKVKCKDSWKLSRYKQFSTEHSNKNLHKYMILYWLNYDKSCQFCVSSDEKHWWPHGHQHRVIWKLWVFFGTKKNWKEWKKCRDTEWKKEDKGFFCFCTDELRYKIQNSGNFFFFFLIDHIVLSGHTTYVFHLSISLCAFGAYIFVPFCIDRTFHILHLAMMSHLEKHSLLIVFAFISSCIIVLCG